MLGGHMTDTATRVGCHQRLPSLRFPGALPRRAASRQRVRLAAARRGRGGSSKRHRWTSRGVLHDRRSSGAGRCDRVDGPRRARSPLRGRSAAGRSPPAPRIWPLRGAFRPFRAAGDGFDVHLMRLFGKASQVRRGMRQTCSFWCAGAQCVNSSNSEPQHLPARAGRGPAGSLPATPSPAQARHVTPSFIAGRSQPSPLRLGRTCRYAAHGDPLDRGRAREAEAPRA